jgi:hypothetical protein
MAGAPTLVFCENNNNPSAGTITPNITTINYASKDYNSTYNTGGNLITQFPVPAGQNSFEKYINMKVVVPPSNTLSGFSIYFGPGGATPAFAPTDGAGSATTLNVFFGIVGLGSYAAPTAALSSVALTNCNTDLVAPGTTFGAPSSITVGSYSGYFVTQLQVQPLATGGNCGFPSPMATVQYTYS